MQPKHPSQQDLAVALLKNAGIVRAAEFRGAGIASITLIRMQERGLVTKLARGLYQLPDAELDINQTLAEVAKHVSSGVICLVSALAFHGLTDTIPSRVWVAIGPKARLPVARDIPTQFVRFPPKLLSSGVEKHIISGVALQIYKPAKTIVDLFRYRQTSGRRYRQSPGLNVAIEGLREALRQRKTTPAEIARYAREAGAWKVVEPYLDAMTANV